MSATVTTDPLPVPPRTLGAKLARIGPVILLAAAAIGSGDRKSVV